MRWLALVLFALQAATCGQKGPLTLPESTRSAAPEAIIPVHPGQG